jgi:hypothetical protein
MLTRICLLLALIFIGAPAAYGAVEIRSLSNRADLVSGGDALLEIAGAPNPAAVRVDVDGRDVTAAFAVRADGRFSGLVTGLRDGANVLTASLPNGTGARLTVTSHPRGGPVFAGPQTMPWECRNDEFGLGKPTDAQCNTPSVVTYVYKSSTTGQLSDYDPDAAPSDVATTRTDEGRTVPYIVRVERGVIDRGIYELAVLADPAKPWTPFAPQEAWNGKLYWTFGGDCTPMHRMADATGANLDKVVAKGFLSGMASNTNLGSRCDSTVNAETFMMLKEHIAETLGPIRYALSEGCSGGSMQQNWITSDYPGLLDGIQPSCSYPDIWQTMQQAEDCHLLDRVFDGAPETWTVTKQTAITGYVSPTTCRSLWDAPGAFNTPSQGAYARNWLDPDNGAGCLGGALSGADSALAGNVMPQPSWVYDANTNRTGARCTLPDYMVSIFGRRPDGFANRPYDNAGVQYGLRAVQSGTISAEDFVSINEQVGGLDIDWNPVPQRSEADPTALEVAYRAGLVNSFREQRSVPVMDLRGSSNLEIHTDFNSYVQRARRIKANGHADNHVIWTSAVPLNGEPAPTADSLRLLDMWVGRIKRDTRSGSAEEKVLRNKPADAVDACWIAGRKITDAATCRIAFPYYADPRITAGGPWSDDVLKCHLRPLDRDEYAMTSMSDAQFARLAAVFPAGVCDYTKRGVGEQPSVPWLSFADGPGGRPLGSAPSSAPYKPAACPTRRRLTVSLGRRARGVRSVVATINGKRVPTRRVRLRKSRRQVVIAGAPRGRVTVRIVARLRGGRRVVVTRRYRACAPRR